MVKDSVHSPISARKQAMLRRRVWCFTRFVRFLLMIIISRMPNSYESGQGNMPFFSNR